MDSKIALDIILQSLDIIHASRIWQDKTPSHTLRILLYMHSKGWLYAPAIDGKVQAVIGAYRVSEVTDEILGRLPQESIGKILYIPFVISVAKEDNMYVVVRHAMKEYLSKNTDIEEIVLEGKDDKLRRYKIGEQYGKN